MVCPPLALTFSLRPLLPLLCLGHSGPQSPQGFPRISHWASPPPGTVGWDVFPSPETEGKCLELKTNRAQDPGQATEDKHQLGLSTSGLPPPDPLPPGQRQRREQAGKSLWWQPCANLVCQLRGDPLLPTEPKECASTGVTSQGWSLLLGGAAIGWSL